MGSLLYPLTNMDIIRLLFRVSYFISVRYLLDLLDLIKTSAFNVRATYRLIDLQLKLSKLTTIPQEYFCIFQLLIAIKLQFNLKAINIYLEQKQSLRGVLRNFAKFTGNHLCHSLFVLRLATLLKKTLAQVFSSEFCKISENTFSYRTTLMARSVSGL